MFQLLQIDLVQFKNYRTQTYSFSKKVIGICGANGTGKTNLLDAIWYLCFTKSYFSATDAQVATQGTKGFRVAANFLWQNQPLKVVAVVRETGKKEITVNEELYPRLSSHIGRLPAVMIAPDDVAIINGGSEERRRLFDTLLCQINPEYLQRLMDYNKVVQQRNSLLKSWSNPGPPNETLLTVLDKQLIANGSYIYQVRNQFLGQFLQMATAHYHTIAQAEEAVQLTYESQLHASPTHTPAAAFEQLLLQSRSKDLALQRTSSGTHRDDLKLLLNGLPFKQVASQGQRKSLLFALKLTEYEMLQQHKGFAPLLLLDDVFEKLDNQRMTNLLAEVCVQKPGQVFITDTHRHRLEAQLSAIGADFEIIEIE